MSLALQQRTLDTTVNVFLSKPQRCIHMYNLHSSTIQYKPWSSQFIVIYRLEKRNDSADPFFQFLSWTWTVSRGCSGNWELNGPSIKLHEAKTSRSKSVYKLINELPTHTSLSCSRYLQSVCLGSQWPPQGYCLLPRFPLRMAAAYWVHRLVWSQKNTQEELLFSILTVKERCRKVSAKAQNGAWFRSCRFYSVGNKNLRDTGFWGPVPIRGSKKKFWYRFIWQKQLWNDKFALYSLLSCVPTLSQIFKLT